MKAAIIYFSGTGNTYRVGEAYQESLEHRGYDVDMYDISTHKSQISGYHLLIFGSPTYSKVASAKVMEFINQYVEIDQNQRTDVMTFVTHSWGEAFGHLVLANELEKRGFKVTSALTFLMPNNHYAMTGKKNTDSERQSMYRKALEKVERAIHSYERKEKLTDNRSSLKRIIFEKLYKTLRRKWIPNYASNYLTVDEKKCTKCAVCVKECPNENIKLDSGKINFGSDCLACTKCFNICPVNAYNVNGKRIERYMENRTSIKSKINA